MYERFRAALLLWLRVPPQPEPPAGAPGSVQIFRSGRNAFRLSLVTWGVRQGFALVGLLFGLWFLGEAKAMRSGGPEPAPAAAAVAPQTPGDETAARPRKRRAPQSAREYLSRLSRRTPDLAFWIFTVIEGASVVTFLVQIPLTYSLRRLEYEQRWYIVTDRSLRLRDGVWKLREVTMSFANLQQITVTQGPLQRLLGLSDVRVQSAGGGGGVPAPGTPEGAQGDGSHLAVFREVERAGEIRDLILERLRSFRESGLGDPDEVHRTRPAAGGPAPAGEALSAARELLAEARALRGALSGGRTSS